MNQWITSQSGLETWLETRKSLPALALDTEFMREKTFYPQLALVQIGDADGKAALFDPLPEAEDGRDPRPDTPLTRLLSDAAIIKVMHSASEDLQALLRYCNALPRPLFDTQIAAALCGMGPGLGYQRLIAELLGAELDKSQTRSDWLRRPLSEAQQHYAAEDVTHLLAAYEILRDKLVALGRLDWLQADCERLLATGEDVPDPEPQLSFRPAERMNADQQRLLRRLLRWRDQRARSRDLPRTWVIDNDSLLALIYRKPKSRNDFEQLLDAQKRAPRRARDELYELINTEFSTEETDIPLSEPQSPWLRERSKPVRKAIADLAEKLEIPEGLLCNRKLAEQLVASGEWPDALQGWRRELLESELTPILQKSGLGAD
ncbi:MAG: ribonuclease D [Rhodanobacteraceae bacterium]|nr:ribonuclease D [Xanthomonadales bacterium]MCP5478023.1 ribonuclease D [Rhodanobacteraceae bacterium]HPF73040.1 ribonuclease D [Xanthomonadaceae bacterium]HRX99542.1 ribonuclease D [Xanthomonadaceae bacterium]